MEQKVLICFILLTLILIFFLLWYCFILEIQYSVKQKWERRKKELKGIEPEKFKGFFESVYSNPLPRAQKNGKIFVSVASYRDDQCLSTIQNLAENADHPELLRIVVCQQNDPHVDKDCQYWCKTEKNPACEVVEIERLNYKEARGPCWARWKIQQKYQGEEYFLQLDAHTRVTKGWDTLLKKQLKMCNHPKPCLTQYPPGYKIIKENRKNQEKEKWQTHKLRGEIYIQKIGKDGFTRIQSDWVYKKPELPFESKGWGACFSFSSGNFISEVPYDPLTPFLFFGEEMDIAVRAFTNGWKFYSPNISCVFTNFDRSYRKTFWENENQESCEILSRFRIYDRLGYIDKNFIPEEYKFVLVNQIPMGKEFTKEEYYSYAGIDIKNEKLIQPGMSK